MDGRGPAHCQRRAARPECEILRSLYRGIEQVVIDPEDEYWCLAETFGGTYIRLGAPGMRLNPFDLEIHTRLDGRRSAPPDALTRRKFSCTP
ncbi:hypothetical protein APR11_004767 [Nocardia amikacinitolerans]|uniref:hypothetical protein n=1 Tax=Nocardia amikacinitolerans TaxID=756689 RepID=UPI0020A47EA6|nr:hypothetical protein [Nocardia amikacinitolerans]MCP2298322.1 hypothetical protein [Nocardia amikacinitolerans]